MFPRSPLGDYLDMLPDLREVDFAARLGALCGGKILQSSVSMWATGSRLPPAPLRALIERATNGRVSLTDWLAYERRRAKMYAAERKAG